VLHSSQYENVAMINVFDQPLTDLGQRQVKLLGDEMARRNFHGTIYASPFLRTMQTAEAVAERTNSMIIPVPCMHEPFKSEEIRNLFRGMCDKRLIADFPHVKRDLKIEYPWWSFEPNNFKEPFAKWLKNEFKLEPEVMFIGHNWSVGVAMEHFGLECTFPIWNASLSSYDTETKEFIHCYTGHFPTQAMISSNSALPFVSKDPEKHYFFDSCT